MLNLSNLRRLLLQVLSLPALHTAVLFTPEGHLVSFASDPSRSKDDVRVLVGVSSEIWRETREQGIAMVDSEVRLSAQLGLFCHLSSPSQLGRLLVLPVEPPRKDTTPQDEDPVLLLAVNAEESVPWKEVEHRVCSSQVRSSVRLSSDSAVRPGETACAISGDSRQGSPYEACNRTIISYQQPTTANPVGPRNPLPCDLHLCCTSEALACFD